MSEGEAVRRLREENDALREELRQLKAALAPEAGPLWPSLRLTATEHRILAFLFARGFARRDAIICACLPLDLADPPAHLNVYILRLRAKLAPISATVDTVWGQGYRLSEQSCLRLAAVADWPKSARAA